MASRLQVLRVTSMTLWSGRSPIPHTRSLFGACWRGRCAQGASGGSARLTLNGVVVIDGRRFEDLSVLGSQPERFVVILQ